jgi:hypothetical protein
MTSRFLITSALLSLALPAAAAELIIQPQLTEAAD